MDRLPGFQLQGKGVMVWKRILFIQAHESCRNPILLPIGMGFQASFNSFKFFITDRIGGRCLRGLQSMADQRLDDQKAGPIHCLDSAWAIMDLEAFRF